MNEQKSITSVPGILVGHAQDVEALTGVTVILCPEAAVAGVDQRGGAPGTRETDLLRPMHLVQEIHAVALCGGSAFGLAAAQGVMRYLEARGAGYNTGVANVPIVPAAVVFDLGIGRADVRPTAEMGYQACLQASADILPEGNVGAGAGATVGKALGMQLAMKSGIGSASLEVLPGTIVGALAVVNAFGDVIEDGQIIAGTRSPDGEAFADTLRVMQSMGSQPDQNSASKASNTVIGVVATNAWLTKEQINKVAQMAHDGLARSIRPAHTMWDGDTIFALSTGKQPDRPDSNTGLKVSLIGAFAAEVFSQAVVRAVRAAQPAAGLPSAASLQAKH